MMSWVTTVIEKVTRGRDYERDARLREHAVEVGNRSDFQEQNAAIATFAVQRVETVKHRDHKRGEHDQEAQRSRRAAAINSCCCMGLSVDAVAFFPADESY